MKRSRKMVFVYALGVLLGVVAVSWFALSAQAERGRKSLSPPTSAPGQNGLAAALNQDGTLRSGLSGSFNASGYRMELSATGAPRFVTAAACSGWDTQFSALNGLNSAVTAIIVSGTDIYVGGSFTLAGNVAANRVAKFNTLTNTWSALGTGGGNGVDGPISALAVNGSDLYVGGSFTTANVGGPTISVNNIAKVNTATGVWSKLGTGNGNGVNNTARALAVGGSDLFVAGAFSTANVNGTTVIVNGVAKFNTLTNTWSKLGTDGGSGVDFDVFALALNGSDLYVGGNFRGVNLGGPRVSAIQVAKVNTATGVWSALGGDGNGVSDQVKALAVSGSDVFVGGQFRAANVSGTPISTNNVARFNTLSNTWSKLGTDGNGVTCPAIALAVSGSDLYVGGCFTTANVGGTTVSTNGVAKFNTTTGVWSALADMGGGNGVDDVVLALAPSGSGLFVGGHFTAVGDNKPSSNIARYCLSPALPAPQANTLAKPVPTDPLLCAGDLINGSFAQNNTTAGALSGRVFATLQNLAAIPASVTCTLNPAAGGATTFCAVENGAPTWRGTLAAGQGVTISYQAQVTDGATGQVCSIAQSQFPDVTGTIAAAAPFCLTINCPTVGPGLPIASSSEVSSQKAGSVLFYNLYSSSIAAPNTQNTRVSLTNTNPLRPIAVHVFFVDGATCSIADSLVCLTPNQTTSFLASDIDPGTTGYIVAVASDLVTGCPADFNYLIGDEYVKLSSGHAANLTAESFAALPGGLPACNASSVTTVLNFDNVSYNRAPRALAASNIPARADGNDTLIVLNRVGGSLATGAATLGALFGILYDDTENPLSFSFTAGVCQFRSSFSNNFPRTAPRFEQFIPAGRSGWARFYSFTDIGLLGAQINFNPNAGTAASAFNQGHNLHKLTLTTTATFTIPIFPPNC